MDNDEIIKKMHDIQRRVNSFKNLDPIDFMIQYDKISPELEDLNMAISNQATNKILETGELPTGDLLKLITCSQMQLNTKIEVCFSILKKLSKDVKDLKRD